GSGALWVGCTTNISEREFPTGCTAILPPWKPIFPLVLPQRWPTRPPPRLCGAPVSCCASSQSICSMAPIPAVRQKRSKELSTSCQAVSRLGTSDEGVVIVVMALLFFADSTPRAYRLKVGNASLPNSTAVGTFPSASQGQPLLRSETFIGNPPSCRRAVPTLAC